MILRVAILLLFIGSLLSCVQSGSAGQSVPQQKPATIGNIPLPAGYTRIPGAGGSYTAFLRGLGLKQDNNRVYLYDGQLKDNQEAQYAVLTLDVGQRDLQQCADAAMRLRAEYLYAGKRYKDILFYFNNGEAAAFERYAEGWRATLQTNNKFKWIKKADRSYSYKTFREYMDLVFSYAGTSSLKEHTLMADWASLKPGHILVQTGSPYGHAVTVMDVAVNKAGKKIFLLAQSYMPAQEIHVLVNENNASLSPWYEVPASDSFDTPEWRFARNDLQRWKE